MEKKIGKQRTNIQPIQYLSKYMIVKKLKYKSVQGLVLVITYYSGNRQRREGKMFERKGRGTCPI